MENRISVIVPKEVEEAFLKKIAEAEELVKPYLVQVSDKGKGTLLRVGDGLMPFVVKCLEYAKTDLEFAPRYLEVEEFSNDVGSLSSMDRMNSSIDKLNASIDDTRALLANDSYAEATAYYRAVKDAARGGDAKAKVIYEDLSKWFTNRAPASKA